MRASSFALIWLAAAGCHRSAGDAPPCGAVAGRFFALAYDELGSAAVDATIRREVTDQLPAMRDALTQLCSDGKWSGAVRSCLAGAGDHAAFEACERQLTDPQRAALAAAADGKTPPP
jgi:hypothetical protein